jgi:hypothetical protein
MYNTLAGVGEVEEWKIREKHVLFGKVKESI